MTRTHHPPPTGRRHPRSRLPASFSRELPQPADRGASSAPPPVSRAASLRERVRELVGREIGFIHNRCFRRPEAGKSILAEDPAPSPAGRSSAPPAGTPAYFAELYQTPLLTADQELRLFRRMNYLKYLANVLRARLDPARPRAGLVRQIEVLLADAAAVRSKIVTANLRLVVSIARRFAESHEDFEEMVSDGNVTLINAVEKFDYARGFRFSTYATHAIQRDFFRQIRKRRTDRARFVRGVDEFIADAPDDDAPDRHAGEQYHRLQRLMRLIGDELDAREQRVLTLRFGLDGGEGPQTLQVIGDELGVSKERVRQLEIRAIEALRKAAAIHPAL